MILQLLREIHPVTRIYLLLIVATTALIYLDVVTPFSLFYSQSLLLRKFELWRLITPFLYFGEISIDWFFHVYFLTQYCQQLEAQFAGRTADYLWMLICFMIFIVAAGSLMHLPFFSHSLVFAITYMWSRRNPNIQVAANLENRWVCSEYWTLRQLIFAGFSFHFPS